MNAPPLRGGAKSKRRFRRKAARQSPYPTPACSAKKTPSLVSRPPSFVPRNFPREPAQRVAWGDEEETERAQLSRAMPAEAEFLPARASQLRREPSGAGRGGSEKAPFIAQFSPRSGGNGAVKGAFELERDTGIEPATSAWEADVLPIYQSRISIFDCTCLLYQTSPPFATKILTKIPAPQNFFSPHAFTGAPNRPRTAPAPPPSPGPPPPGGPQKTAVMPRP